MGDIIMAFTIMLGCLVLGSVLLVVAFTICIKTESKDESYNEHN